MKLSRGRHEPPPIPPVQVNLTHAPMLGALSSSSVRVWVRTDQAVSASVQCQLTGGDWSKPIPSTQVLTASGNDLTAIVSVSGLMPNTSYDYRVLLGGVVKSTSTFKTAPVAGDSYSFAFGSCIDALLHPSGIFDTIAKHSPLFMLMIGDQIYYDNHFNVNDPSSRTEAEFWSLYSQCRETHLQNFGQTIPFFTVWDDHDYGIDNSDNTNPLKTIARAAFGKYWPNPDFVENNAAIYYKFTIGDAEFFMLDTRFYRDRIANTILGANQAAWLNNSLLSSTARFKFIVTSVTISLFGTTGSDSWDGFSQERTDLYNFLTANNIKNVFFLSGDQHWSGAFWDNRQFYELMSSPLAHDNLKMTNASSSQLLYSSDMFKTFGLVSVNGATSPGSVSLDLYSDDDANRFSLLVSEN